MPNTDYENKRLPRKVILISIIIGVIIISCLFWSFLDGSFVDSSGNKFTTTIMRASFTNEYKDSSKGSFTIEVPEVYELIHIIMAITDYGIKEPYMIHKDGDYYELVLKHFLPYKDHPAVQEMNSNLEQLGYYTMKNDSFSYIFNGGNIEKLESYATMFNIFSEQAKQYEDFARVSGFREFYKENQKFYEEQINEINKKVEIRKMWVWLEKNFPDRYDSYRIVFSPLVGGSHNTIRYRDKDNEYNEIIMFVSGPDIWESSYSGAVEEGLLSSNVFTEIDHQYINPITDEYIKEVDKCFRNLEKWNNNSGYKVSTWTFNEYMTWAAFNLFAYENYKKDDFDKIMEAQENLMIVGRGFTKYKEFNRIVMDLYINREKGTTLYDLYPEILRKAKEIK